VQRWQNFGHGLPVADLAASFQQVVCKVLVERSVRCAVDQGLSGLVVVGGVSANGELRRQLGEACELAGLELHLAPMAWCTDNAAMIGLAACKRLHQGQISQFNLGVAPRWPLAKAGELYGKAPF
jgi:N6-L-threonylcarbamoyladenine synthase